MKSTALEIKYYAPLQMLLVKTKEQSKAYENITTPGDIGTAVKDAVIGLETNGTL